MCTNYMQTRIKEARLHNPRHGSYHGNPMTFKSQYLKNASSFCGKKMKCRRRECPRVLFYSFIFSYSRTDCVSVDMFS
uniref:Uncharacterized protein n=1 Tax=Anguilla anguilla TaxID=7936 RepID=A0A0E9WP09_ANGAN